jgi:hypothetical protein
MTPKEKARELVDKFKNYSPTMDYDFEFKGAKDYNHNAKESALLAVNEILSNDNLYTELFIYYSEVKREIEKL